MELALILLLIGGIVLLLMIQKRRNQQLLLKKIREKYGKETTDIQRQMDRLDLIQKYILSQKDRLPETDCYFWQLMKFSGAPIQESGLLHPEQFWSI